MDVRREILVVNIDEIETVLLLLKCERTTFSIYHNDYLQKINSGTRNGFVSMKCGHGLGNRGVACQMESRLLITYNRHPNSTTKRSGKKKCPRVADRAFPEV